MVVDQLHALDNAALIYSSAQGHLEFVKFLIYHGTNINATDYYQQTALICAAHRGHLAVVKFLVEHGATIEASDHEQQTALIHAASKGHLAIVQLLLDYGANIDATDDDKQTALICAVNNNYFTLVNCLIERGASLEAKNEDGDTALICATNSSNIAIMQVLLAYGADINTTSSRGQNILMCAVLAGDITVVQFLLNLGIDVNLVDHDGTPALMYAAITNNIEIIELLIDNGANIAVQNNDSETPLIYAAKENQLQNIAVLLKRGANINQQGYNEQTAIKYAAIEGNYDVVYFLLTEGAAFSDLLSDEQITDPRINSLLVLAKQALDSLTATEAVTNLAINTITDDQLFSNLYRYFILKQGFAGELAAQLQVIANSNMSLQTKIALRNFLNTGSKRALNCLCAIIFTPDCPAVDLFIENSFKYYAIAPVPESIISFYRDKQNYHDVKNLLTRLDNQAFLTLKQQYDIDGDSLIAEITNLTYTANITILQHDIYDFIMCDNSDENLKKISNLWHVPLAKQLKQAIDRQLSQVSSTIANDYGPCALINCTANGYLDSVIALLNSKANISQIDRHAESAISYAMMNKQFAITGLLLDHNENSTPTSNNMNYLSRKL